MTCTITNKCISCEGCLPQCPTGAIQKINDKLAIDPNLCNDCVGFYGVPQCMAGCPTFNGCISTVSSLIKSAATNTSNYWDNWFATYNSLLSRVRNKQETQYWQHWFNTYSQKLSSLVIGH